MEVTVSWLSHLETLVISAFLYGQSMGAMNSSFPSKFTLKIQ